jgi:serine protease Do
VVAEDIAAVAAEAGRAVVGLRRGGRGSGVVVSDTRVLTAASNLRRGAVQVITDRDTHAATVTAVDRVAGLAVLAVEGGLEAAVDLVQPASQLGIGTGVAALANPWGQGLIATVGLVASAPRDGSVLHAAAVPAGGGGGALIAARRLVGINVARLEGGLVAARLIDPDLVERLVSQDARRDRTLGVILAPPAVARRVRRAAGLADRSGLLVRRAEADTPAARAGIREGDLLVSVDGAPLQRMDTLLGRLDQGPDAVVIDLVRGADEHSVRVEFGS